MSLIGGKVNSIWLSGWNYDELKNVEKSQLLVVLPYGKYAWKILKKRLGVDTLEIEVPFGLKNTINFVKSVWEKLWIDKNLIDKVLKKEIQTVKEKINMLDEKVFLNKNFIYAWDPNLVSWIEDFSSLLWINLIKTFNYNWGKVFYDEINEQSIDFVIWNSEFELDEVKKIEFWFPSYNTHFLTNRAFMGFEGVLNFVERVYNKLLYNDGN
jgi:nitrogenase molybdenum-iron protein alpha/beta subunit